MASIGNGDLIGPDDTINLSGERYSVKQFQNLYNAITGKTETKTKNFSSFHKISTNDIDQLNAKIEQILDTKHVVSSTCQITIYHIDDIKEQFSSYERAKIYNISSVSPTENYYIEYNFAVVVPGTLNAENYSIKINLHSRIGIAKKELEGEEFSPGILRYMGNHNGNFSIQYINYTIAREFLTAIEEWYRGVEKSQSGKFLKFTQKNSHYIPTIFQILTNMFIWIFIFLIRDNFIGTSPSIESLFGGFCIAFAIANTAHFLAGRFGGAVEAAVDSMGPLSYVKINRGDEMAISEYNTLTRKNVFKVAWRISCAILVNIISAVVASLLKIS